VIVFVEKSQIAIFLLFQFVFYFSKFVTFRLFLLVIH